MMERGTTLVWDEELLERARFEIEALTAARPGVVGLGLQGSLPQTPPQGNPDGERGGGPSPTWRL